VLHQRALSVLAAGDAAEAERCFEVAATCYRDELAIEALARLRVHQLMARAQGASSGPIEGVAMIEIVRRLNRLDRLETLEPPFELEDARTVLTRWIEHAEALPATTTRSSPGMARAA
jgi:hypothetical protein